MEYNKAAAKWWADKLRNVGLGNFNMGDDGQIGGMAMMLGFMLARQTQPNNEAIDQFEKRLAEVIEEKVSISGSLTLDVDYGPDYILGSIANEVGVSTNGFPWKTTMWIKKDSVEVSYGYAASIQTIFPEQN